MNCMLHDACSSWYMPGVCTSHWKVNETLLLAFERCGAAFWLSLSGRRELSFISLRCVCFAEAFCAALKYQWHERSNLECPSCFQLQWPLISISRSVSSHATSISFYKRVEPGRELYPKDFCNVHNNVAQKKQTCTHPSITSRTVTNKDAWFQGRQHSAVKQCNCGVNLRRGNQTGC